MSLLYPHLLSMQLLASEVTAYYTTEVGAHSTTIQSLVMLGEGSVKHTHKCIYINTYVCLFAVV